MKALLLLFGLALAWAPVAWAEPLAQALARSTLRCELRASREWISLIVTNASADEATIAITAGTICATAAGERFVALRAANLAVPASGRAEAQIPAAALAATSTSLEASPCQPLAETEPRLAPLLAWLATRPDVPRATSQLVTLALLEDIAFAPWLRILAPQRPADIAATPAEVAQAIDALGILREIAPERTFALATDAELKLRALRNPWSRAKAAQLYGLTQPDENGVPAALPPELGQLLHTKTGDNCPVCRLRQPPDAGP